MPTPEERVQLQTVDHKARTAVLFGIVTGAILALAMYLSLR
jgi:hypothetical protein